MGLEGRGFISFAGATTVELNRWYHLVMTYAPAPRARLVDVSLQPRLRTTVSEVFDRKLDRRVVTYRSTARPILCAAK